MADFREGITTTGLNVLAALAIVGGLLGPQILSFGRPDEDVRTTREEERVIADRVRAYRARYAPQSCPDLHAVFAHEPDKIRDVWGRPMRVQCNEDDVVVWSAGPDGRFGTRDDV